MSSSLSPCRKTALRRLAAELGAYRTGFARAGRLSDPAVCRYAVWIERGCHASMDYLERHAALRADPRLVMPGARTVISMAFPYGPAGGYHHPHIADYALGADYHRVLRARLEPLVRHLADNYGALSRVCVDTAPVAERYWAVTAGVGFTALNGRLYVPGAGSRFFLTTVLTTLELAPDEPCAGGCTGCGACVRACPGGALLGDGTLDARRCHSYLTIEHRDALPAGTALGPRIYGCDVCSRVCPLDRIEPPEPLDEFRPDPRLISLDRAAFAALRAGDWRRLFGDSAVRRAPASRLRRNAGWGEG